MDTLLVRDVRLVDLDAAEPRAGSRPAAGDEPPLTDLLVRDGRVVAVAAGLEAGPAVPVLEGEGAWVAPGLWDQHVHLDQWALQAVRIDTSAAACVEDVLDLVRLRVASPYDDGRSLVQGYGHRSPDWPRLGTAADLDAVVGDRPVVLISGDAHHGWLSTAALRRLGLPTGPGTGIVEEAAWFDAYGRLDETFGEHPQMLDAVRGRLTEALALGVTGIVDLEFGGAWRWWPERAARGMAVLRVRAATYAETLDEVLAAGLRSGDALDPSGLVTMGPLKLISDGSLNTRTAYCCTDYCDRPGRGVQNFTPEELVELLARARDGGLDAAVHAIGDAAVGHVLDAFEATGARGSVEHAQLVRDEDVLRLGRLGGGPGGGPALVPARSERVTGRGRPSGSTGGTARGARVVASVQPAHLLDDRDLSEVIWADRSRRCFPLRSLLDAGATLAMGSDAPVAPLDPWLAMAAAVHRSADERGAWHPEQALTARQALAASVDGRRVRVGEPGDLVLLDEDPTALPGDAREVAARLRGTRPRVTVVAGRVAARR